MLSMCGNSCLTPLEYTITKLSACYRTTIDALSMRYGPRCLLSISHAIPPLCANKLSMLPALYLSAVSYGAPTKSFNASCPPCNMLSTYEISRCRRHAIDTRSKCETVAHFRRALSIHKTRTPYTITLLRTSYELDTDIMGYPYAMAPAAVCCNAANSTRID